MKKLNNNNLMAHKMEENNKYLGVKNFFNELKNILYYILISEMLNSSF